MKKIFFLFVALTVGSVIQMGCSDDFVNKQDLSSITTSNYFTEPSHAIAAVNATYAPTQNLSLWGRRIHFMLDFSSDEVGSTPNTQGAPFELLQHTFGPAGNEHIDNPWNMFYRMIAKANIVVDRVPAIEMDASLQNRVIGEAKFLRALAYFYVNTLWGGGPLRTEKNSTELMLPRAAPAEIWSLIEQDLTDAIASLPQQYGPEDAGRATWGAAKSLLGKAYLYQERWADAEAQFDEVISSGVYQLEGEGATSVEEAIEAMRRNHDFDVKNNVESVFEIQFKAGEGGLSWNSGNATGRLESTIRPREYGVDGNAFYNAKPSDALIAAHEGNGGTAIGDRDPRIEAFYFTENSMFKEEPYLPIFESSGFAIKKYQDEMAAANNDNNVNHDVIRYADVILMSAEAKIQQGKVAEGVTLINQIRRRADPTGDILPDITTTDQGEALEALIHERRIELAFEQVRRMDLVRWGIADQFISGFVNGKHELFPIPQGEIDNNTEIDESDQNPGY